MPSSPPVASGYADALLDAVPTGIVVANLNGEITYLNNECSRLFGYTKEELLGQSVDLLLPKRFLHGHAQLRESYFENPTQRKMGEGRDLFGKRKDNSEFPLEIGLQTLDTTDGKIVVATIVDITLRKQLDARFVQMIEASPYGKLLVDEQGIIQLINPSLVNLFGYTKEELLGQSMDILLPERYRANHSHLRESYNKNPSLRAMGVGRDLTGRHKNGTEIPIEIGINPLNAEKGNLTLAVVTDISERKRMELNLKQANAHLEEFTYVASHDLKSPLRGILDLVEWIVEDFDSNTPPSMVKNIERVKIRISRMERLVEDLLLYARAGKRIKESVSVDLKELFKGIIELQPPPEHFTINTDIQLSTIQTAKTPLETVLRNLYSNAIKHHDGNKPSITLRAEASGNFCLFTVADNGPSIPEAAKDRVFRLFQTLTATERAGSGIGLALVKRLTESHGGHIELMTKDGERGATFKVLWPRFSRKDLDE